MISPANPRATSIPAILPLVTGFWGLSVTAGRFYGTWTYLENSSVLRHASHAMGGENAKATTIDEALQRLYREATPRQWRALLPYADGGPDRLEEVQCYPSEDRWHYIGRGLCQLDRDATSDAASGWGFEITFKLRRRSETQAPSWPAQLLQELARYVCDTGDILAIGDHLHLGHAIDNREDGGLVGVLFIDDPNLDAVHNEHLRCRFVQAVPVTIDELEAAKDWSCEGVLKLLSSRHPDWVTDPNRESIRQDADVESAIREGIRADGSARSEALASTLLCNEHDDGSLELTVTAHDADELLRAARSRLPFGRPFSLRGSEQVLQLWPSGKSFASDVDKGAVCRIELDANQAAALSQGLSSSPGHYTFDEVPGLRIRVLESVS